MHSLKCMGNTPIPSSTKVLRSQHTSTCPGAAPAPPSGDAANHLKCVVCVLFVFITRVDTIFTHLSVWRACMRKKKKKHGDVLCR